MSSAIPPFTWEEALHEFRLHLQATRAKKTQQYYDVQLGGLVRWATKEDVPFAGFGLRTGTDSTTDPYSGFGGQHGYYADAESGLLLLGHRYYDAGTGRFLNRDPLGYAGGADLYAYCGNNPIMAADPSGFCPDSGKDGWNTAANLFGGFGHIGSFGLTDWINSQSGANDVVDATSSAYKVGEVGAIVDGLFLGGASTLYAGAKTVFYSGQGVAGIAQEAPYAARAAKGSGMLLEDTLGGKILNALDQRLPNGLPVGAWKAASAVFALNAKGTVTAFLRNLTAGNVWKTVEEPILNCTKKNNRS